MATCSASNGQRIYRSPVDFQPIHDSLVHFMLHNEDAFPTLDDGLKWNSSRLQKPAFIDFPTGKVQTFAEVRKDVEHFARAIANPYSPWCGVSSELDNETVVAIYSPNNLYYFTALLGTLRAGCIATTANPHYTANEFAYQLQDSNASIVVAGQSVVGKAVEAMGKAGIPEAHLVVLPDDPRRPGIGSSYELENFNGFPAISFATLIQSGASNSVPSSVTSSSTGASTPLLPELSLTPELAKKKISYLVYSSGTTGTSKGVMLTHSNVLNNVLQLDGLDGDWDYPAGTRVVGVLPCELRSTSSS